MICPVSQAQKLLNIRPRCAKARSSKNLFQLHAVHIAMLCISKRQERESFLIGGLCPEYCILLGLHIPLGSLLGRCQLQPGFHNFLEFASGLYVTLNGLI